MLVSDRVWRYLRGMTPLRDSRLPAQALLYRSVLQQCHECADTLGPPQRRHRRGHRALVVRERGRIADGDRDGGAEVAA
jgi:hypothetical protein